jgi:hypothetical protein
MGLAKKDIGFAKRWRFNQEIKGLWKDESLIKNIYLFIES